MALALTNICFPPLLKHRRQQIGQQPRQVQLNQAVHIIKNNKYIANKKDLLVTRLLTEQIRFTEVHFFLIFN